MTRFNKLRAGVIGLFALAAVSSISAPAFGQQTNANCALAGCVQAYIQSGVQSFVRTYKFSQLGVTPAAATQDLLTLTGSSTRTIRITKIVVGGIANTAGQLNPQIVRRSTPNQAGTSTVQTAATRDTTNGGVAAVATLYTANPTTLGTFIATLDTCRLFLQTSIGGAPDVCAFTYGVNNDQLTVLRGSSDILAINFGGGTVPAGGLIDIDIEWTEDNS